MKNDYRIVGDTTEIFIHRRKYPNVIAFVDTSDLPELLETGYQFCVREPRPGACYVVANTRKNGKKKMVMLHRILMGFTNGLDIDHIDRNPLNNKRENLRVVTRSVNLQNRSMQRNNTSGYKGVSYHKRSRKWQSYARISGNCIYLGLYDTPEQAAKVSEQYRITHYEGLMKP